MRARLSILHVVAAAAAAFSSSIGALAQSPVLLQQAGNTAKVSSQLALTLTQRTTPGSLVVACFSTTGSGSATISGAGVSQWTVCVPPTGGACNVQIFAGVVDGSPSRSLTVSQPGGTSLSTLSMGEWRGFLGIPQFATSTGSGSRTDVDPNARTAPIFVGPGDLAISMLAMADATQPVPDPVDGWKILPQGRKQDRQLSSAGWSVADADTSLARTWPFTRSQNYSAATVVFRMPQTPSPAPNLVQHVGDAQWNILSMTLTLPQVPAPGSLLVICHESNSSSNSRVSGGGVGQWTMCLSSAPIIVNTEVWAGIVGPNPTDTITITLGSGPNGAIASVSEWTGFPNGVAYEADYDSGPTGGTLCTTPIKEAKADELLIAMVGIHQGGNTISLPTNGFTQFMQGYLPSTGQSAAWRIAPQDGLYSTSWTLQNSTRWSAPLVVFGGR